MAPRSHKWPEASHARGGLDSIATSGDAADIMYPGGKNQAGTWQRIVTLMPPHHTYIEPFGGSLAVMRAKCPACVNVGRELDPAALELARSADWSAAGGLVEGGVTRSTPAPAWGSYDLAVGDGMALLESWPWTGGELVYCDPPYLHSTRGPWRPYRHEWDDRQHRRLLRWAVGAAALGVRVMVSGYWSALYASALAGWSAVSWDAMSRGGLRREWLWYSYPRPIRLHDYRYLGEGYRERERLRRMARRWKAKLAALPGWERDWLLSMAGAGFRERERVKRKVGRWLGRLARMGHLEKQALLASLADAGDVRSTD